MSCLLFEAHRQSVQCEVNPLFCFPWPPCRCWVSWRSCAPACPAASCCAPPCPPRYCSLNLGGPRWVRRRAAHPAMPAGQLEASTAMVRALFDVNGHRETLLDRLHTLTMPTLVVWGARNYVLPAYQAQATVHRLPRGRLSVFPDCGHLPRVECPDGSPRAQRDARRAPTHPRPHRAAALPHVDL
jgi:pimeloyl-ACP methyl ester carboxylesterase